MDKSHVDFNLDRIMARSVANARILKLASTLSSFSVLVPAEPRRLSLMIALSNRTNAGMQLILQCVQSDLAETSVQFGHTIWCVRNGVITASSFDMAPATDAGAVQTFAMVDENNIAGTPNDITGTGSFAATLTPSYTGSITATDSSQMITASPPFRLTLRDDGDLVRQQWWGMLKSESDVAGYVFIAESLAQPEDCACWAGESTKPYPRS